MRGDNIDRWTGKTHHLFDWIAAHGSKITTIGVGDGGNEIGMGAIAWETIVAALRTQPAARIASRVATDFALIGGVNDWAAYALALAFARLRGLDAVAESWNAAGCQRLVEHLVTNAGAVVGLTRRSEATVDGLAMHAYLQPLAAMRKSLGFATD
jgi:hypothetical protein